MCHLQKNLSVFISVLLAVFLSACGSEQEQSAAPKIQASVTTTQAPSLAKQRLLFFMNPNGRPCQVQDQILTEMGSELTDKVQVQYLKTTEMASAQPLFQQYGIRALPTLILLDASGNVAHRMTPGIQDRLKIKAIL